ncbi:hypothetical protein ACFSC4_20430 [Deinococcus malanensis]|uniref:hypothetical protein n=1 Tax=Deinococcus malanensis TaxID=1706855 RepID=UPI001664A7D2|nr:hypothetical protein [Deinococcus malanensis]
MARTPALHMRKPSPSITKYHDTYPPELATTDELKALGLKPGTFTPAALLEYHRPPDVSGV